MAVRLDQPIDPLQRGEDVVVVEDVEAKTVRAAVDRGQGRRGIQIERGLVVEPGLGQAQGDDHDLAAGQLAEGVLHHSPPFGDPLERGGVDVVDQLRVVPEPLAHLQEQLLGRRGRLTGGPAELVLDRLHGELRDDVVLGLGGPLVGRDHDVLHRQIEAEGGQPMLHLARETRADGHDPIGLGEGEGRLEGKGGELAQTASRQTAIGPHGRPVAAEVPVRIGRR